MTAPLPRFLDRDEADLYLASVGTKIGDWNELRYVDDAVERDMTWMNYKVPRSSRELYSFAHHAGGWPPTGSWKIIQIDNSSNLQFFERSFIESLLKLTWSNEVAAPTILFETSGTEIQSFRVEILVSAILHHFLLHEQHCYCVSSGDKTGPRLGVQDGYVHFISRDDRTEQTKKLIGAYENDPSRLPDRMLKHEP